MPPPPLLLRPWRPEDAPELRGAIDESLAELRQWMTWGPDEPTPLDVLTRRLAGYADDFHAGLRWRFAVVHRLTGQLLGGASLHPYPGPGALEVGYWVRWSEVRQGIAACAAGALTRHAFAHHQVERVEIWCDPGNVASARVALALGFEPVGNREIERSDGSPRQVDVYRLEDGDRLRLRPGHDVLIAAGTQRPPY
ncbi:GNAT family protein [Longimicrobium sp.]|jgi:RimJ/RimL family protein N-acetyltransferase|uniref:GNAT family N-acetyltransferase n=1 Tax=Longimicrobium sp. TaxID=2029185 RepID=UPI002F92BA43